MKTTQPYHVRQGDVLVRAVESIPKDTTDIPRENGKIVLAHGEVTGHSHAIASESARFVVNEQALRFLDLDKRSALRHEEHREIRLPAGQYEVTIQREFDGEYTRNVAD